MKKYKYNYSKLVLAIIIAGIPLAVACIALNILRLTKNYQSFTTYNYLALGIILLISVAYIVIAISLLIDSSYYVTDKHFVLKWGLLKNEIELKSITKIVLNTSTDKLAIYYNDEDFFNINSKNVDYGELVSAVKEKNKKIVFEMITDNNSTTPNT